MRPTRRVQSSSQRRTSDLLQPPETPDLQPKMQRYLLYTFSENQNAFIKKHKSVLQDIDFYNKIKLSREEMDEVEDIGVEKMYKLVGGRIGKDQSYRNESLKKSRDEYYRLFCEHFGKNNEIESNLQIYDESISTQNIIYSSNNPSNSRLSSTSIASPPARRRPQSFRQACHLSINTLTTTPPMFNNKSLLVQMKTITSQIFDGGKSVEFAFGGLGGASEVLKGRKETSRVVFHGERVVIDSKNDQRNQILSSKYNKKIAYRHTYRKSIDQIEKEQIQNKIGLVNSILSVSLPIPQGYKPKSRCWQNFFI